MYRKYSLLLLCFFFYKLKVLFYYTGKKEESQRIFTEYGDTFFLFCHKKILFFLYYMLQCVAENKKEV